jgi:cell division protein YceG involved in septum cleavage
MKTRKKYFFTIASIIFVLMCVLPQTSAAQAKKVDRTVEKRQEQLKKQEEIKKEKSVKQAEARRQKHIDIQTKEVQKRMKRSKKKSKRINDNRRESFLSRWFRK